MKILIVATSFRPEHGGPARSASGLINELVGNGLEVTAWAPDGSAVGSEFLPPRENLTLLDCSLNRLCQLVPSFDLVHDNALWLPHNHALAVTCRRRGIRRLVTTHGLLAPWALRYRRIKKWVAWNLYQRADLMSADALHATSREEARDIARLDLAVPVHVVANGLHVTASLEAAEDTVRSPRNDAAKCSRSKRTACFLGRIHPVKGLPMLIDAWQRLRPTDWQLMIAGPDEGGHQASLQSQIDRYGLSDRISFLGQIDEAGKQQLFADSEIFILPSLSESFAIVLAEAAAAGLPLLTTTAAPWPQIDEQGFGWRVEPTNQDVFSAIKEACDTDPATLAAMGRRARAFVGANYDWPQIAAQMLEVYGQICRKYSSVA